MTSGATAAASPPARERDLSQLLLIGILAVLGVVVAVDASRLRNDFAKLDPVGPKAFPYAVAAALLVLAALLAVSVLRGSVPEAEEGEDIDLTQRADWTTVAKLVGVFVFLIATVNVLGWAISGALFFAGCSLTLGSRTWLRDLAIGTALSVATFYAFYSGLGVPLPAGILDGIL
ncbi:tripartite tricarboxylate transporter TctB family protein [Luteipulveratus flavus]|uniref:Tripartite tricarboxylate transporter TctB family protein n=1 Tax=Luteipulveratus flavus TaxID=3031728 RepID=A0ABT6C7W8_9MICO|nr:tripartite tricarboxylate transporter TctB family protein [Luteipulveratus sp. YIM 133296]MDF8264801.1 tripartite tricarboxylate transporter TctB family protein [Luteipulveratus sp. YIM 133296]